MGVQRIEIARRFLTASRFANLAKRHDLSKNWRPADDAIGLDSMAIRHAIRAAGVKPVKAPVRIKYIWRVQGSADRPGDIVFAHRVIERELADSGIIPNNTAYEIRETSDTYVIVDGKQEPSVLIQLIEL